MGLPEGFGGCAIMGHQGTLAPHNGPRMALDAAGRPSNPECWSCSMQQEQLAWWHCLSASPAFSLPKWKCVILWPHYFLPLQPLAFLPCSHTWTDQCEQRLRLNAGLISVLVRVTIAIHLLSAREILGFVVAVVLFDFETKSPWSCRLDIACNRCPSEAEIRK